MDKPKAVLVYEDNEKGILAEGLIYAATEKIIKVDLSNLEDFESDYCRNCEYYYAMVESPRYMHYFLCDIRQELENFEYIESEYDYCLNLTNRIYSIPSMNVAIESLEDKQGAMYSYCLKQFKDYIETYREWEILKEEKNCEGGSSTLKEYKCREHNAEDFIEIEHRKVKLPSHLWLKLTSKEDPLDYYYSIMGFLEGYITPALRVGNVSEGGYSVFDTEECITGDICWGSIEPSSNIKTAYNQFWSSIFNDEIYKPIPFERFDRFSDIFLEWVQRSVKDNLYSVWTNNFLLEDGKLRTGVKLHKLIP